MLFNPIFEFETLRRLADEMFSTGYEADALSEAFQATNIYTDNKSYVIHMATPGVEQKDVNVDFSNGVLTVSVKRQANPKIGEKMKQIRSERVDYNFTRSFTLGDDVDITNIEAQIANGFLMIRLPRKPEAQPKKIEVKVK